MGFFCQTQLQLAISLEIVLSLAYYQRFLDLGWPNLTWPGEVWKQLHIAKLFYHLPFPEWTNVVNKLWLSSGSRFREWPMDQLEKAGKLELFYDWSTNHTQANTRECTVVVARFYQYYKWAKWIVCNSNNNIQVYTQWITSCTMDTSNVCISKVSSKTVSRKVCALWQKWCIRCNKVRCFSVRLEFGLQNFEFKASNETFVAGFGWRVKES